MSKSPSSRKRVERDFFQPPAARGVGSMELLAAAEVVSRGASEGRGAAESIRRSLEKQKDY